MKKIYFLLLFMCGVTGFAQQADTVQINKGVLLFYDSSDYVPVMRQVPFGAVGVCTFYLQYENTGALSIDTLFADFEVVHLTFLSGAPGQGLMYSQRIQLDSLDVGERDTFKHRVCAPGMSVLGEYQVNFKMHNTRGLLLDSSSFLFGLGDTILSKHNRPTSTQKTGPSFFIDSLTNQPGGTVQGDRFATLFEVDSSFTPFAMSPSSITFYISNDSNNVGAEFYPRIWKVNEDSIGTTGFIGDLVATSFIPETLQVGDLGQHISVTLDNGPAVFSWLPKGKYAVGFESILPMPNGKSVIVGRDTLLEQLQFGNTSYVSFGQDTSWYLIDDLPMIRLNFGNLFPGGGVPCQIVGLDESTDESIFSVYPNPSKGVFEISTDLRIKSIQVFDMMGRLVQGKIHHPLSLYLGESPKGVYVLQIQFENGVETATKLILEE